MTPDNLTALLSASIFTERLKRLGENRTGERMHCYAVYADSVHGAVEVWAKDEDQAAREAQARKFPRYARRDLVCRYRFTVSVPSRIENNTRQGAAAHLERGIRFDAGPAT